MIIIGSATMIVMLMTAECPTVLAKITEWSIVEHPAVAEHNCAVDEPAQCSGLMQDNEHARPTSQQFGQYLREHLLMLQVNSRGGLVQHQEIGITGKSACDQHSLLLAA